MKSKINKYINNDKSIFIFAILFLLICFYVSKPIYESNDDMGIIGFLSGRFGNGLDTNPIFISPILGMFIAWLYKINPLVPWYGLILYILLLISLVLGLSIILKNIKLNSLRWTTVIGFLSLYMYICVRLNWASCSLVVWFLVFLYACSKNLRSKSTDYHDALLSFLLLVSYLLRPDIIKVGFIFVIPLIFMHLLSRYGRQRLIIISLPVILFIGFTIIQPQYSTMQPQSYKDLQMIRGKLKDTRAGSINKNTEFALKQVGWTRSDLFVFQNWWTHDETMFNYNTMTNFAKYNNLGNDSIFSLISIKDGVNRIYTNKSYFLLIILTIMLLVLGKQSYLNPNISASRYRIIAVGLIFYTFLMLFALACIRFPMRVAIPIYIYLLLLFVILKPWVSITVKPITISIISILVVIIFGYFNFLNTTTLGQQAIDLSNQKDYFDTNIQKIKQLNGTDTIFFNLSPGRWGAGDSPLREYKYNVFYNRVPEGCTIGTNLYYQCLKKYGVSSGRELCLFTIDNPKAVFCIWLEPASQGEEMNYIIDHFDNHYGKKGAYKIEQVLDARYDIGEGNRTGWLYFRIMSI